MFGCIVGSTSDDGAIAADDDNDQFDDDDDDDDDDDGDDVNSETDDDESDRNRDDTIMKETAPSETQSERTSSKNAEEEAVMKTTSAEDREVGNTSDDGPSSSPKRERNESPETKRSHDSPERRQPAVSAPPTVDARGSVLRAPGVESFSEPPPMGSSVARLESFVASMVAADRKRPTPFGEVGPRSPPPQPALPAPTRPVAPPPPVSSRSRHAKIPRTGSGTSKSPTTVAHAAAGGRVSRPSRGPAPISVPPSFVSPLPAAAVDQPLDLSTKSRHQSQYLSPDAANSGSSSLLSLERQFGKGSAIFDRIGTKAWAAPYCAAALRLGVQSLAFGGGGLGLVSPPSPSTSRRLAAPHPSKDRESVAYPPVARHHQPPPVSPTSRATAADVTALLPWAQTPDSKRTSGLSASTSSGSTSHVHTNLRCSCGASMDNLFALTVGFLCLRVFISRRCSRERVQQLKKVNSYVFWIFKNR